MTPKTLGVSFEVFLKKKKKKNGNSFPCKYDNTVGHFFRSSWFVLQRKDALREEVEEIGGDDDHLGSFRSCCKCLFAVL